ncbi:MAG: exodeoxyribonuclease VII small subunit [Acidimicrobiales bacterium]|nr:exodeoxyribonuclease VII small subunit [Acidimicrobiales bacterium]
MSDTAPSDSEVGYADAMAELESILDDLEDDDLDVDVLASRVERASTLITLCRDRIGAARVQVEKIVASLDAPASDDDEDEGDDGTNDGTLDLDPE